MQQGRSPQCDSGLLIELELTRGALCQLRYARGVSRCERRLQIDQIAKRSGHGIDPGLRNRLVRQRLNFQHGVPDVNIRSLLQQVRTMLDEGFRHSRVELPTCTTAKRIYSSIAPEDILQEHRQRCDLRKPCRH
jgi:hypothetical protein